mmetsp:Transcript_7448/g.4022  ORF Transcript_7448/g.4022 Transcript_7448/m.4022 type:complete len:91 (-) Transcript_7448:331-603(-)
MTMFADLKDLPRAVGESAFRLFDMNKSGRIDFREFCVALSICCLSSTEEKIRFIFGMFDNDDDGYLNKEDMLTLLNSTVKSMRRLSTGPG